MNCKPAFASARPPQLALNGSALQSAIFSNSRTCLRPQTRQSASPKRLAIGPMVALLGLVTDLQGALEERLRFDNLPHLHIRGAKIFKRLGHLGMALAICFLLCGQNAFEQRLRFL